MVLDRNSFERNLPISMDWIEHYPFVPNGSTSLGSDSSSGSDSDSGLTLDRTREGIFVERPTVPFLDDSRYLTPLLVSGHGEARDEYHRSDSSLPTTTGLKPKDEKTVPNHQEIVKDKIRAALKLLTFREPRILIQFWSPRVVRKHQLLTTQDQPFGLGVADEGLCLYRTNSEDNLFVVDKDDQEEDLSPPARVFRRGLAEWTSDVTNYLLKHFPQQDCAVRCDLCGYLALPVFDSTTSLCVGVLELLMSLKYLDYAFEVQQVHKALETENLTSPQLLGFPTSNGDGFYIQVPNGRRQQELDKILDILKSLCDCHRLPLAQTWSVSPFSSFVSHDKNLHKCCSSFNTRCIGKVCVSAAGLPFYVRDLGMSNFREACRKQHLEKSRGLVGRALTTQGSCFCGDVTQLSEEEYPLVHNARMCGLTSCFAIFLHGLESNDDYVLEFFLPLDINDGSYLVNLVQMLKHSIKVTCGLEVGPVLSTKVGLPRDSSDSESILANFAISYAGEKSKSLKQNRKRKIDFLSLEAVEQHLEKQIGEAARSLGVSVSTLKRFCWEHGVFSQIANPSHFPSQDEPIYILPQFQESYDYGVTHFLFSKPFGISEASFFMLRLTRWRNRNRSSTKGRLEYTPNIIPQNKQNLYSVLETKVTAMVTVKVSFKKDMVRFQIPLSAGLLELESQVTLRFVKLKGRNFFLKCVMGDDDAALIACDADLHNLLGSLATTSTSNGTIKLMVHLDED